MHFDDRLSTVLRHSANSGTLARIQFRQLVDILAQAPADLSSELAEQGYARLDSLGHAIRAPEQAELIRQSLVRLTNPRLLAQFAQVSPHVASAALAKTRLEEEVWLELIPALPVHARGILRHRRDLPPRVQTLLAQLGIGDRALPPAEAQAEAEAAPVTSAQAMAPSAIEAASTARREAQSEARPEPQPHVEAASSSDTAMASAKAPPALASEGPAKVVASGAARHRPTNEAEVEEMVLTCLLGDEPPCDLPLSRHAVNGGGGGKIRGNSGSGGNLARAPEKAPLHQAPPSASPSDPLPPAVPTSLREWARLRTGEAGANSSTPLAPATRSDPGIGAIVRRIEEFRRARQKAQPPEPANDSPRLPLGDAIIAGAPGPSTIDFATDPQGRINWADGPHAPAVTGFTLAAQACESTDLAVSVRRRLPIRGAVITLAGTSAISGDWQVDAAACFEEESGRFTGYCGRLRRVMATQKEHAVSPPNAEADRMRQVLHELRTPANAIQVAAEIIQQQLYGPAPHEYRALAASVAGDCAHILAGFEELDRLVKLETGALRLDSGLSNMARIISQTIGRLGGWTRPRNSGFAAAPGLAVADLPVALDHDEAERIVWRLLAALAGASASDERLALDWSDLGETMEIRLALPTALAEREGESLFAIGDGGRSQALTAGVFGVGFTLRLAAAEAAASGGSLQRIANDLVLTLPLAHDASDSVLATDHRS